jgi:hypothetical protein
MADRIDAPVQDVQAPRPDGTVDSAIPQPQSQQLPAPHNPVLAIRQARDRLVSVASSQFTPHIGVKCELASDSLRLEVPAAPELPAA